MDSSTKEYWDIIKRLMDDNERLRAENQTLRDQLAYQRGMHDIQQKYAEQFNADLDQMLEMMGLSVKPKTNMSTTFLKNDEDDEESKA